MTSATTTASDRLYDSLADHYDEHFEVAHRKAYDDLAWELCEPMWADGSVTIVDVGCGVGRWSRRWLEQGHSVIGIEPSPRMADAASARLAPWLGDTFTLHRGRVEEIDLPAASVDAVLAMGSLQYSDDPTWQIARMAKWLRPGGHLAVLTDSLWGLVVELARRGDLTQADDRLASRRGVWRVESRAAEMHLLDAATLQQAAEHAGLHENSVNGLLMSASFVGVDTLRQRLADDYQGTLAHERALAQVSGLADFGKQLLLRASC